MTLNPAPNPLPTPTPGPDALAWLADGVRHQILLRALPAQRHDVLGPLSATRLGLSLLRRRLQPAAPVPDGADQRLADLAQQVGDAVAALALMRLWDVGTAAQQPLQPLAGVLQTCAGLLRTGASLRGLQIHLDTPDAATLPALPAQDAHYAVLGWLMHHLDHTAAPARLVLGQGSGSLLLHTEPLPVPEGQALPMPAAPARPLPAAALGWLLADIGWTQLGMPAGNHALAWPQRG